MPKNKPKDKMIKTSIDLTSDQYQFLKIKALERKMRGEDPSFVTILRELIDEDHKKWKNLPKLIIVFIVGLLCTVFSLSASASYLPFNTNVNMNVGIGTSTPQGAFVVTNGNVGIGTWAPSEALIVQGGNVGIGTPLGSQKLSIAGGYLGLGYGYGLMMKDSGGTDRTMFYTNGINNVLTIENNSLGTGGSIYLQPGTSGAQGIYIQNGGNVGIGTITPQSGFVVTNGNVGIGTWTAAGGNLIVNGGGNVGIGSLTPGQLLDVQGTVRMTGLTLTGNGAASGNVLVTNGVGVGTWMAATTLSGGNSSNYWSLNGGAGNVGINTSYAVGIGTTFVGGTGEAALSVMNGNVGIGTWAPAKPLSVTGDSYFNGNIGIGTTLTSKAAFTVMNGNVGIGTWVPADVLNVANSVTVSDLADAGNLAKISSYLDGAGFPRTLLQGGQSTSDTAWYLRIAHAYSSSAQNLIAGIQLSTNNDPTYTNANELDMVATDVGNVIVSASGQNGNGLPILLTTYDGAGAQAGIYLDTVANNQNVGIGTYIPVSLLDVNRKLNVFSGGNVGIGSLAPGQKLDVQGTVRDLGEFVNGNVGIGTIFVNGAGEGALTVMNGNVGIGTWVPAHQLDILYSDNNFGSAINVANINAGANAVAAYSFLNSSGTRGGIAMIGPNFASGIERNNSEFFSDTGLVFKPDDNIATGASDRIYFITGGFNNNPTLTITGGNTGNVGIGTINPAEALDVAGGVGIGTGWNSPYVTTTAPVGGLIVQGNVGIGSLAPGQALDINGTARMTGFTLTGNGAASGNVLVTNGVGVGTWMSTLTLPIATVTAETPGDVTYYSTTNGFAGGTGFQTNGTNVGIGTSNFTNASLQVVGNIGIGTVKNGDNFINTLPPNGGMIVEGNVGIGTWAPGGALIVRGGNVGIGTSIPVDPLVVMGAGASGDAMILENTSNGGGSTIDYQDNNGIQRGYVGWLNSGYGVPNLASTFGIGGTVLTFSTNVEDMRITNTGNVGIGTTTPAGGLAVMNGNVGIGTWVPFGALDVVGNELLLGGNNTAVPSASTVQLVFGDYQDVSTPIPEIAFNTDSGWVGLGQADSAGDTYMRLGPYAGGANTTWPGFGTYSNTFPFNLAIDGGVGIGTSNIAPINGLVVMGNVGLGTWGPQKTFSVTGDAYHNGNIGIGTTFIGSSGEAALTVMNGNVGIGTWTPAYNLDLVNGTARQRNVRRVQTTTTTGSLTINTDQTDEYTITALAANITFNNPTGTPNNGDLLEIRVLDNGTARTLTWGTNFGSTTTILPLTTVVNITLRILLEYDSAQSKWECIGVT